MTDNAGTVVWTNLMMAFGEATVNEDPGGDSTLLTLNMRFPGQYEDAESGLYQNFFRDYDPVTGRYIESDPLGWQGGLNFFGYSDATPTAKIDPLGLVCRPLYSFISPFKHRNVFDQKQTSEWQLRNVEPRINDIPPLGKAAQYVLRGLGIAIDIAQPDASVICLAVNVITIEQKVEVFHYKYIVELCLEDCPPGNKLRTRKEKILSIWKRF